MLVYAAYRDTEERAARAQLVKWGFDTVTAFRKVESCHPGTERKRAREYALDKGAAWFAKPDYDVPAGSDGAVYQLTAEGYSGAPGRLFRAQEVV